MTRRNLFQLMFGVVAFALGFKATAKPVESPVFHLKREGYKIYAFDPAYGSGQSQICVSSYDQESGLITILLHGDGTDSVRQIKL